MEIKMVKIEDLKPAEYNPRQMTKKQAKDLTTGIRKFGLVEPIVVNSNPDRFNTVIGGHQRIKIEKQEGKSEVPVNYVNLSEEDEKELNLRLNKNIGSFDIDILANNFDIEFLEKVGFNTNDLNLNIDKFSDDINESLKEAKEKIIKIKCPECGHEFDK